MDIKKTGAYDLNWTELTQVIQDRISCDDCFENWSFIKVVNFWVIWVTVTIQKRKQAVKSALAWNVLCASFVGEDLAYLASPGDFSTSAVI
jgi:hypothetical protein